jgi:hypothetical protein
MAEISISATRGLWTDVSMLIMSTLVVAIRLITRLMVGFSISLSDWLILLGWGLTVAYFSRIIHCKSFTPCDWICHFLHLTAKQLS